MKKEGVERENVETIEDLEQSEFESVFEGLESTRAEKRSKDNI